MAAAGLQDRTPEAARRSGERTAVRSLLATSVVLCYASVAWIQALHGASAAHGHHGGLVEHWLRDASLALPAVVLAVWLARRWRLGAERSALAAATTAAAAGRARAGGARAAARRREDVERAERRLEDRRSSLARKYDLLDEKDLDALLIYGDATLGALHQLNGHWVSNYLDEQYSYPLIGDSLDRFRDGRTAMSEAEFRVWPGLPVPLGATWDGSGTNFAAERCPASPRLRNTCVTGFATMTPPRPPPARFNT
jgi:hypothetical protein